MLQIAIGTIFVAVGALKAVPLIGALGERQLRGLYGLGFADDNLLTLMRHRAVMLGLIGLFLIAAGFRRELQPAAFAIGFASMLSFIFFARLQGEPSPWISRVAMADMAGSALLFVALVLYWLRA